jgi:hypothetical protein
LTGERTGGFSPKAIVDSKGKHVAAIDTIDFVHDGNFVLINVGDE